MPNTHPTHDKRSTQNCTEKPTERMCVVSDQEGLHLHGGRNLFQAVALLTFAAVGAIVGYFLTDGRPDLAALVGGALGMIIGTFLSGFVLMFLPPPATTIALSEIQNKYRRLKRRLIVSLIAFAIFMLTIPLVISRFGHDDSTFAWVMCLAWIAATFGLCVYTKMLAYRLREWKSEVAPFV